MKKSLLVLGMIACIFGLTACGKTDEPQTLTPDEQTIQSMADEYITQVDQVVASGQEDQIIAQNPAVESVFTSWDSAMEELGSYTKTISYDIDVDDEKGEAVCDVKIAGSNLNPKGETRTATVQIICQSMQGQYYMQSFSVTVDRTFGELMKNAGLNTLLGMGTVFSILILISIIISGFSIIRKIESGLSKKEEKSADTNTSVDNTIAQIIENEELSDDSELVAVISAAIATYEAEAGNSGDGFVVRSIRRANTSKWQRA